MAVRTPLKIDGNNNLKELTTAEMNALKDLMRHFYGADPTVTLSKVASNGDLGTISDTRLRSGASSTSTSSNPDEATTAEPDTVTVNYARIDQTVSSTSYGVSDPYAVSYPLYWDGTNVRAMTLQDMRDTFCYPVIDTLTGSVGQPGTYRIHTSTTLSGYTAVSTDPIFSDTRANVSSFSADSIGTSGTYQDHPTTITNFYLLKANNISKPTTVAADLAYIEYVYPNATGNIKKATASVSENKFAFLIKDAAQNLANSKIRYRYSFDGSGTNLGSGITNTILTGGDGVHNTRFVNTNDYRAQEFPDGTASTASTTYLRVYQAT